MSFLNSQKYSLDNISKALYLRIFKPKQIINAIKLNFDKFSKKNIDFYNGNPSTIPTNFFKTLIYLIKNYSTQFNIFITGIDITNRKNNILNTMEIKNDLNIWHSKSLNFEELKIQELLKENKIFILK